MAAPVPVPLALGRFKQLPQRESEIWQASIRTMPMWIDNPDDPAGPPYRPTAVLWVSLRTGLLHLGLSAPGQDAAEVALSSFLEFGSKWAKHLDGRPRRIEVKDERLLKVLGEPLASLNTPVDVVRLLPQSDAAFRALSEQACDGVSYPGALDAPGVTPERLRAFAEAAAAFYRARPWTHLGNDDLIVVEAPPPPKGMAHLCVLGNGGQEFGLSFHASRHAFERLIAPTNSVPPREVRGVTYGPIDDLPFADVDAWEEHRLPVAGPRAYPMASRMRSDGTMKRPAAAELTFMESVLRALAVTSEDELDTGRWQHDVETHDGRVTVTLTLPLLLEATRSDLPPRPAANMMTGAGECGSIAVARFLESRNFASLEDLNAALEQARTDGTFAEAGADRARTPAQEAQDLAYDAMEATGRLRVTLARRAVVLSPDCADAWIVLGGATGDSDARLAHYDRAVAAGARTIGEAFDTLAGEFWAHLETRPYMRARLALAQTLLERGDIAASLEHHRELLRLNPNDNQGVRYLLLPLLFEQDLDEEAGGLLERYAGDIQAIWPYGLALWHFRRDGDSTRADEALTRALEANLHVAEYLLDPQSAPFIGSHFALGGAEEGAYAAETLMEAFARTPGALDWLRRHWPPRPRGTRPARSGRRQARR